MPKALQQVSGLRVQAPVEHSSQAGTCRNRRIVSSSVLSLILRVALSPFLLLKKLQIFILVLLLFLSKKPEIES